VLSPQIFTRPTSAINCISSWTWGAGRPQVGLCPRFLVLYIVTVTAVWLFTVIRIDWFKSSPYHWTDLFEIWYVWSAKGHHTWHVKSDGCPKRGVAGHTWSCHTLIHPNWGDDECGDGMNWEALFEGPSTTPPNFNSFRPCMWIRKFRRFCLTVLTRILNQIPSYSYTAFKIDVFLFIPTVINPSITSDLLPPILTQRIGYLPTFQETCSRPNPSTKKVMLSRGNCAMPPDR